MAKTMDIVDAFKALLDGGCILQKFPPVSGKIEYKVLIPTIPNCAMKCIGHITEKQYDELYKKNIISLDIEQARGKVGNLRYYWFLVREDQHENT